MYLFKHIIIVAPLLCILPSANNSYPMPLSNSTAWAVAIVVNVLWCGVAVFLHLIIAVLIGWSFLKTTLRSLKRQLLSGLRGWVQRPLGALRSVFSSPWYQKALQSILGHKKEVTMTRKATKFTPEVLLSAPRRSPAVPSPNGKKALFTVSETTGSFGYLANQG